jgi:hypothetical protein
MRVSEIFKKAFGYLLMSMGVSSPVKRPVAVPKPAAKDRD